MVSSKVIQANIEVHTRVADSYNKEPHFRPENKAKVRAVLAELRQRCGGGRLLDLGCGTGFVIDLARDLFDDIHGVDVTEAMLRQVDTSSGNVTLHKTPAEHLPFADNTFHLVTAYSFLHHLEDYWQVLRESARVLQAGGICYVDCEPNKDFWSAMTDLAQSDSRSLPPRVLKGRESVLDIEARIEKEFGIPQQTFCQAEYAKSILGGLDAAEVERQTAALGFRSCAVRHDWFLGQAEVMHGQSIAEAACIDAFLRSVAPLSNHLFKYLQFIFVK